MNAPMSRPGLQIREADSRDAAAILELYRQLVRPVAPDVEVDVRADRLEQIRSDPHNFVWVLETDDGVVGTAFVTLCLDPMHNGQLYAVLENFVIERCRAKGYGAQLMRYASTFAIGPIVRKSCCKATAHDRRRTHSLKPKDSLPRIRRDSSSIAAR
jgi:N-acetylglutamate synthase-like GNAT family acetyltransferase